MNYKKIYDKIISRGKNRVVPLEISERHHIIPKCVGGADDKENLVSLTPREHYFCHLLLTRIYPEINGIWFAYKLMRGRVENSSFYNKVRTEFIMRQKADKFEFWAKEKGFSDYSEVLSKVRELCLKGYSYLEISESIGYSQASVNNAISFLKGTDEDFCLRYAKVNSSKKSLAVKKWKMEVSADHKEAHYKKVSESQKGSVARRKADKVMSETRKGTNNPSARKIVFCGKEYGSIREAEKETGIAYHTVRNRLKSSKHTDCYYS